MSETASFVDPVFLARFGLSRANVLEYFLHPLNPFRSTTAKTITNEHLASQQTTIGMLMAQGLRGEGPMPAIVAEDEYNKLLSKYTNEEQYELLPPEPPAPIEGQPVPEQQPATLTTEQLYTMPSPLYVIRHVFRSTTTSVKVLGIYYCVEGVIYKSPAARSLMKTNVARCATAALSEACRILAPCARYSPATGYCWVFEESETAGEEDAASDDECYDPIRLLELSKKKRRKVVDNRRPDERTPEEEEGIRASEALDQILVRLTQSEWVKPNKPHSSTETTTTTTTVASA